MNTGRAPNPEIDALKAKAKELRSQGLTLKQVAEAMNMSEAKVTYYIYADKRDRSEVKVGTEAVAAAKADRGRLSPDRREQNATLLTQVAELRKQQYSYAEIGKKLNITTSRAGYLGQKLLHGSASSASTNGHGGLPSDIERHVSFAAGHISAWLEVYADSLNVSRRSLSEGVMGVLKARR